jgi:hypothetical protein
MKRNIKIYYDLHFGLLQPLSPAELNELCTYESWLPDLPQVLYYPETSPRFEKKERKRLRTLFRKVFNSLQN